MIGELTQIMDNLQSAKPSDFGNPNFLEGYRAFVFGGRGRNNYGASDIRAYDTSLEPYDNLTDFQKKRWKDGVDYARKERKELSEMFESHTYNPKEWENRRESACLDLKAGVDFNEVREKYKLSFPTVYKYARLMGIKLRFRDKYKRRAEKR